VGDKPQRRRGLVFVVKERSPAKAENYLTLSTLAKRTSYSPNHLRHLLQQGKVSGLKVGNVWLAKRSSVEKYRKVGNGKGDSQRMKRR